ncbi:hypothetical protein JNW90_01265 [Micromonospora sp. STR1s_5]|nr:hypothetical protein [Micromonospora sp. STR1s_5]
MTTFPQPGRHDDAADALLRDYVIGRYRDEIRGHLAECPGLTVAELDATDGVFNATTDAEFVRLESVMTCPHGERDDYFWGTFGTINEIIEDIEAGRDPEGDER